MDFGEIFRGGAAMVGKNQDYVSMNESAREAEKFRQWADGFLNFEKTPQKNIFWLDTMFELSKMLSNPEKNYKSVHIAGSKGKGSVSKMISSILSEAGYNTGIYSSPHIIDFAERICRDKDYFPKEVYQKAGENIFEKLGKIRQEDLPSGRAVTWFELVTLYGLECFKVAGCDWAVLEVGLGGRLDATNIVSPEICVINRIEKEHTEYLGDTLELIAAEKGGIIKPNTPVVIGRQPEKSVENVFKKIADEKQSPIIFADKISKVSNIVYKIRQKKTEEGTENHIDVYKSAPRHNDFTMDFKLESDIFSRPLNISLQMLGEFQADNASVAAVTCKTVIPSLDEATIERGLSKAYLPGRFEIVEHIKGYEKIESLVLDGAHTPSSVKFTLDTFEKLYPNVGITEKPNDKPNVLFACAADKEVEDMARLFKNRFSTIYLTIPGTTKSSDLPRAEKAFADGDMEFISQPDYKKAIEQSLFESNEKGKSLLVVGSFYLVSEMKQFLLNRKI